MKMPNVDLLSNLTANEQQALHTFMESLASLPPQAIETWLNRFTRATQAACLPTQRPCAQIRQEPSHRPGAEKRSQQ